MSLSEVQKKKYNKIIPLYFVAFFVVLAILDGIFVYLAVNSQTGLVTENAYEKGIRYNQAIEQAERDKDVKHNISFEQVGEKDGIINYAIQTDNEINSVIVQAIRPINDDLDFSEQMSKSKAGLHYSTNVTFPSKGLWDLLVIARSDDVEYRKKQRVFVK
jgi:nitrogen fixation protein FixH